MASCKRERIDVLTMQLRTVTRGMDVIFHGTRYPRQILMQDTLLYSRSGYQAVFFTRSLQVASYWALLERDDDEQDGAVLVFDRPRLRARYRLVPFHDPIWDTPQKLNDEAEELVWGRNIERMHSYLLGAVWSRRPNGERAGNHFSSAGTCVMGISSNG